MNLLVPKETKVKMALRDCLAHKALMAPVEKMDLLGNKVLKAPKEKG